MENSFKHIGANAQATNKQLKLLWVSVGNEDFLYQGTLEFIDYLKAKNIVHKTLITPGGHTWMNVKTFVAESVPLLFR